jgi:hypothetical protein
MTATFILVPDIGDIGPGRPPMDSWPAIVHFVKLPPPSRLRGSGEGFGASRTALPIPRRSDS